MKKEVVRLGIVKLGCIGITPLLEFILDERANRNDLIVSGFTTGAKLDPNQCENAINAAIASKPDLVVLVCPNAKLPGPSRAIQILEESGIYAVTISDSPGRKAFYVKGEYGQNEIQIPNKQGFIIVPSDAMIGARKEFLDATEMALFNSDILKVLAGTGVLRCIASILDEVIASLRMDREPALPTIVLGSKEALEAAGFRNPYAQAKAMAALRMAESVAEISAKACFQETDSSKYVFLVAAGHEVMRAAAKLIDEAREIEKKNDDILRTPHVSDGTIQSKRKLDEKLS